MTRTFALIGFVVLLAIPAQAQVSTVSPEMAAAMWSASRSQQQPGCRRIPIYSNPIDKLEIPSGGIDAFRQAGDQAMIFGLERQRAIEHQGAALAAAVNVIGSVFSRVRADQTAQETIAPRPIPATACPANTTPRWNAPDMAGVPVLTCRP